MRPTDGPGSARSRRIDSPEGLAQLVSQEGGRGLPDRHSVEV